MKTRYLVKEYEKVREDSMEFQRYRLEAEIEKKRFAYENALYEQRMAQKHMREFWESIQIAFVWAFGAVFFPFFTLQMENVSRIIGIISWTVCPFFVIWAVLCFGYTLRRIKFGFCYRERKRALEQEDIFVGQKALELHKLEVELNKYAEKWEEVSLEECRPKEEDSEAERQIEERQQQMRIHTIKMQLNRLRKESKNLKTEVENLTKEESVLKEKEQRHRRFLIGSFLGEGIGLILLGMPVTFIEVACSSWCLLLPPFVIFPVLCLWIHAKMELSAGEELWINRLFFRFFYENSFQKRREHLLEMIVQKQKKMEQLEQEMKTLSVKRISGCETL